MKIHLVSDLHLEFRKYDFKYDVPECDVVVAAGDIGLGTQAVSWLEETYKDLPVIYIAGNHEFYHHDYDETLDKLKERCENTNVYFLHNSFKDIEGVRFVGSTMWTSFLDKDPYIMRLAKSGMNDYRCTTQKYEEENLTPDRIYDEHLDAVESLKNGMRFCDSDKIVVVTHHAPSVFSESLAYSKGFYSPMYYEDMTELLRNHIPDLWCHGHLHSSSDYTLFKTRVVANPFGYYKREINYNFDSQLVLEV